MAHVDAGTEKHSGDSAVWFTLSRLEGEGFTTFQRVPATETEKVKILFKITDDGDAVLADATAGIE